MLAGRDRFPRLSDYLSSLPAGLDSHPECQAKGSVLRSTLECAQVPPVEEGVLPAPIQAVLRQLPSHSQWLPETVLWGAMFAIADLAGMDEEAYLRWTRVTNAHRFANPVFRFLMSFTSPQMLMDIGASRWGAMHRGTRLTSERTGPQQATVALRFPTALFCELSLRSLGTAFLVALEHSRAKRPQVRLDRFDTSSACFEAQWD